MQPHVRHDRTSNGATAVNQTSTDELEMVPVVGHAACYTSLRDIISTSSTSPAGVSTPASPTSRKNSWDDIPIKNPLVKHAALAYLQPMSTPPEMDDRSWGLRMKERLGRCCFTADVEDDDVEAGCVLWWPIKDALGRIWRRDHYD